MGASGDTPLGKYLQVTGAFGWGSAGSLVVNEALKGERKLNGAVSRVVGFTVRNCAAEVENSLIPTVFEIAVRRWVQDSAGSGTYTPVPHVVILKPGDSAIFESSDFIAHMLNHENEYGLTLQNGVIKRSSRGGRDGVSLKNLPHYTPEEAGYFCFSFSPKAKTADGRGMRLHDPEVKKPVGVRRDGVWKVKDEFKEYFGFLEMSGVHSRRARRTVQQQVAERIRATYQLEKGTKPE